MINEDTIESDSSIVAPSSPSKTTFSGCWECMAQFFSRAWDYTCDIYSDARDYMCRCCNADNAIEPKVSRAKERQRVQERLKSKLLNNENQHTNQPIPANIIRLNTNNNQSPTQQTQSPTQQTTTTPIQHLSPIATQRSSPPNNQTQNHTRIDSINTSTLPEPPRIDFIETGSLFGDRKRTGIDHNVLLQENGKFRSPGISKAIPGPGGRTIRVSFVSGFPALKSIDSTRSLQTPMSKISKRSCDPNQTTNTITANSIGSIEKENAEMSKIRLMKSWKSYKSVNSKDGEVIEN